MAWATPASQNTGDLITTTIWNQNVVLNAQYLKGQDGDVVFEDDIVPNTDETEKVGLITKRWNEGHFHELFASHGKYALHAAKREQRLTWEDVTDTSYQCDIAKTGNGTEDDGGPGQWVFSVALNGAGTSYVANKVEQNTAFDTSFNISRNPYIRFEFEIATVGPELEIFIGYRQTIGTANPIAAAENFGGFYYQGGVGWVAQHGDGSGNLTSSGALTIATGQRHVLEVYFTGGTNSLYYVDGVLVATHAANLPTGDVDWQALIVSAGGGAATTCRMTAGLLITQEDLT